MVADELFKESISGSFIGKQIVKSDTRTDKDALDAGNLLDS